MHPPKNRVAYWDNLKGFLILTVVFAHFLWGFQTKHPLFNVAVDCIYLFHMPAFVFVSGYFGKGNRSPSAEAVIRLLFLYFVFDGVMKLLFGYTSLLVPWRSHWYLLAVATWRVSARYLAKIPGIQLILLAISVFAGFFPSINHTFSAARILAFYPFYMAGYLLKPEENDALLRAPYKKRLLTGLPFLLASVLCGLFASWRFQYSDNLLTMGPYQNPADPIKRLFLFLVAFLTIRALRRLCPAENLPFLTAAGRNSLWIFLFHRPFTLWVSDAMKESSPLGIFLVAVFGTLALCLLFGNDMIAKYLNRFAELGAEIFTEKKTKAIDPARIAAALVLLLFFGSAIVKEYAKIEVDRTPAVSVQTAQPKAQPKQEEAEKPDDRQINAMPYSVMSDEKQAAFDGAFRITFSGDLILLEDQVKRAYTGDGYDFSPVFEYAQEYISSADYAIGVFEGPMAGEAAGYSSSNYGDGKTLYLNFPDEFSAAVRDAGFDLVTTANNHLLDRGREGALRTLDVLDQIGLEHTGSYRDADEKQTTRVKLVERQGIRMAILSYTYGCNGYQASDLSDGELSYLTSLISGSSGGLFEKLKAEVERDFEEAKKSDPDLIIVLPHMGAMFSNEPDDAQLAWFALFKECGADIILGDHSHVVQPAFLEEVNGKKVLTAYCPGHFADVYREIQGDTSMLVDVYIDRATKQVIGGGIVPLYSQSPIEGNYRGLPIYEIVNDPKLRAQLSTDDYQRAENANRLITKIVFGRELEISGITKRYYFDETGFLRAKTAGLELTEKMKAGTLYQAMEKANSICFIGDSLTEGTANGGCPWYEPILEHMKDKTILNFSQGGCTVPYVNDHIEDIPEADLYVIAVGANDVRLRDADVCAMTPDEYVDEIGSLKSRLQEKSPLAEFVFIAPWYSTDGDRASPLSFTEKTALNSDYTDALKNYCLENEIGFVDPNPYIRDALRVNPDRLFLVDHIHPNAGRGVVLYSEAALLF